MAKGQLLDRAGNLDLKGKNSWGGCTSHTLAISGHEYSTNHSQNGRNSVLISKVSQPLLPQLELGWRSAAGIQGGLEDRPQNTGSCGAGPWSHMCSITRLYFSLRGFPAIFLAGNRLNSMQGSTGQWGGHLSPLSPALLV